MARYSRECTECCNRPLIPAPYPLRPQRSDDTSSTTSPVVARQHTPLNLERIHEGHEIVGQHRLLSRARRIERQEARGPVPAQEGCNNVTPRRNKKRRDLIVGVNVIGETVQKQNWCAARGTTLFIGDAEDTRLDPLQRDLPPL